MPRPVRHLSIGINRPQDAVAGFLAAPENFAAWAAGLGHSLKPAGGGDWLADTPRGPVRVRFSPANPHGVADHWVTLGGGRTVYVPLRAIANGSGTEVVFTLIREPGMTDAEFERDAEAVTKDLATLKRVLEDR